MTIQMKISTYHTVRKLPCNINYSTELTYYIYYNKSRCNRDIPLWSKLIALIYHRALLTASLVNFFTASTVPAIQISFSWECVPVITLHIIALEPLLFVYFLFSFPPYSCPSMSSVRYRGSLSQCHTAAFLS